MWQNLKNQLEGQILLHSKFKSIITIILQHKYSGGTRETIKQHYAMECFQANTKEKISTLAVVFGNSILSGIQSIYTHIQELIKVANPGIKHAGRPAFDND